MVVFESERLAVFVFYTSRLSSIREVDWPKNEIYSCGISNNNGF